MTTITGPLPRNTRSALIKNNARAACLTAALVIVAAPPFGAQTSQLPARYTVTDLGTLGGPFSSASAISDSGWIGGFASYAEEELPYRGFVHGKRGMADIGTLGGTLSAVGDVAENGLAVGWSYLADGSVRAISYHAGKLRNLGTLGGNESYASAVNKRQVIVGYSTLAGNETMTHAFLSRGGAGMQDLGVPAGFPSSFAVSVNDDSDMVVLGISADRQSYGTFMLSDGVWTNIGGLGGGITVGQKINNLGQIVGFSHLTTIPGEYHAFLYNDGVMVDLGSLSSGQSSVASSLNDRGAIVGYSGTVNNAAEGFLHTDGVMWNLNDLLVEGSGWTVLYAFDINNAGEIVGRAERNGEIHGVLLTPVAQ